MSIDRLQKIGFSYVGQWASPACRVHRVDWIRYKSGIYAFVVSDEVRYIGLTDILHRRLRDYSRRCFGNLRAKPLRKCHQQIISAVEQLQIVQVYALLVPPPSALLELETSLIEDFKPAWNGTKLGKEA